MLDKLADLLLFRQPSDEDSNSSEPVVTVGSIVWGIMLRSSILIVIIFLLLESLTLRQYWWFMLFGIWIAAVYPGWLQYKKFNERIEKFKEQTLCGSCINFESTGQLCKIFDEHVSSNYIPCEGLNWEPIHSDSEE